MVYLDEFQDYLRLPLDLGDVLAQARGLGVGLTLAHQHLAQLSSDLRAGVLANAGSRVCFRLGQDDASVLARAGRGVTSEDFAGLGRYEAYVNLLTSGERMPWASVRMRPPQPALRPAEQARERSRNRYGQGAAAVESALAELLTEPAAGRPAGAPLGRRPRGDAA